MRILLPLLVALLVACFGPTFIVQQYGGPPRPRESIAILRVNGNQDVRLLFLDNEDIAAPVASDSRLHIEILPGKHTITARRGDERTAPQGSMSFVAEANKVYRVIFAGEFAHLYEVDRDSDKPGKEVSAPLTGPPAESAALPSPSGPTE